ncbi:Nse4 C-terminal-domain-containing protein [Irpex rosettiformis]|uniref:Nse4 C-terminal-domain-containing protein n=1 Tax=Irpex rosettiformis TaxID=378272 RepID=A0ACB8TXN1_9APHY|nr:Nse4 C-terminal-domain-containing protein [Irpex rosettiformis]
MPKKPKAEPSVAGPSRTNDMAYDPDQDPEVRRGVRKDYRNLQTRFDDANKDKEPVNAEDVLETVQKANELFDKVKGTSEATMDSNLLLRASMKSAMLARAMKSGGGAFDVDDFVSKLITFMGGRRNAEIREDDSDVVDDDDGDGLPLDWERIGWKVMAKSRRVPVMDFMLGPLSIEAKKRNIGKRSKLEKNINDQKKPQNITEQDIQRSEQETTKNVAVLENLLQEVGNVNLFRFIVNPNDFGQSVENMFHLSFLIRDGKCALNIEEGEPVIFSCESPSPEDYADGLDKQQMVMELDMATWQRAIEVFDIKEPIIPQRSKELTRIGDKWYG